MATKKTAWKFNAGHWRGRYRDEDGYESFSGDGSGVVSKYQEKEGHLAIYQNFYFTNREWRFNDKAIPEIMAQGIPSDPYWTMDDADEAAEAVLKAVQPDTLFVFVARVGLTKQMPQVHMTDKTVLYAGGAAVALVYPRSEVMNLIPDAVDDALVEFAESQMVAVVSEKRVQQATAVLQQLAPGTPIEHLTRVMTVQLKQQAEGTLHILPTESAKVALFELGRHILVGRQWNAKAQQPKLQVVPKAETAEVATN